MIKLKVTLYPNRDLIGLLQYQSPSRGLVDCEACGCTTKQFQKIKTGEYALKKVKKVADPDMIKGFGRVMFFFQKIGIDENTLLVLHGGNKNSAERFVSTEGSIAIDDYELESLYHLLERQNVLLTVSEESISLFNKMFVAKKVGKRDEVYNGSSYSDALTLGNFNRLHAYSRAKLRDHDHGFYFWEWLLDDTRQAETKIFVSETNEVKEFFTL